MVIKKYFWPLGVLVMAFGFMVIGCDDSNTSNNKGEWDTPQITYEPGYSEIRHIRTSANMDFLIRSVYWAPGKPNEIQLGANYNSPTNKILYRKSGDTPSSPNPFPGTWEGEIGLITFNTDWTFTTTIDWLHIIY